MVGDGIGQGQARAGLQRKIDVKTGERHGYVFDVTFDKRHAPGKGGGRRRMLNSKAL